MTEIFFKPFFIAQNGVYLTAYKKNIAQKIKPEHKYKHTSYTAVYHRDFGEVIYIEVKSL